MLFLASGCKTGNETNVTPCNWTTVFYDDFTRADGPIGANYTTQVNTGTLNVAVSNNQMVLTGPADFWAIRYVNGVTGNTQRVSIKFIGSKHFSLGVTCKSRDLGNNWMSQEFYMAVVSDTSLSLVKSQGSSGVPLASQATSITVGHQYLLQITVDGAALVGSVEDLTAGGKTLVSATDSGTLNTGTIASLNGCCLLTDVSLALDEFMVEVCK